MNHKTILLCVVLGASMQTAHGMSGRYPAGFGGMPPSAPFSSPSNSIRNDNQYQNMNSLPYASVNNNNQPINAEQYTNNNNNPPPYNPPPSSANPSEENTAKILATLTAINSNLTRLAFAQEQQVIAQNRMTNKLVEMYHNKHSRDTNFQVVKPVDWINFWIDHDSKQK